jgi:1-acyl-sn-glycerol-3-phosphate acyltransferase
MSVYDLVRIVMRPIFRVAFRLRATGLEHVPATGGCVVSSQHRSNFDAFLIGLPIERPLRFMAKAEIYAFPPMAWLARSVGAFKVERGMSDTAAIEMAIELAREGWALAIYPEGTRKRRNGEPARPRSGAARVALAARVPVIPVAISGVQSFRLLPPRLPRFTATIGPALAMDDLLDLELHEAAHVLTERWVAAIAALEEQAGA